MYNLIILHSVKFRKYAQYSNYTPLDITFLGGGATTPLVLLVSPLAEDFSTTSSFFGAGGGFSVLSMSGDTGSVSMVHDSVWSGDGDLLCALEIKTNIYVFHDIVSIKRVPLF